MLLPPSILFLISASFLSAQPRTALPPPLNSRRLQRRRLSVSSPSPHFSRRCCHRLPTARDPPSALAAIHDSGTAPPRRSPSLHSPSPPKHSTTAVNIATQQELLLFETCRGPTMLPAPSRCRLLLLLGTPNHLHTATSHAVTSSPLSSICQPLVVTLPPLHSRIFIRTLLLSAVRVAAERSRSRHCPAPYHL